MRKTLIACLSLLTMFGTAEAAEEFVYEPFDGFYLGLNIGETVWNTFWVDRDAWIDNFNNDWALGTVANKFDEFSGGLQVGYNWRCNNSVFGLEIDWTGARHSNTKTYGPGPNNDTLLSLENKLNSYGTIRGRAGLFADSLYLYITGGAASAKFKHNWLLTSTGNTPEQGDANERKWGGVGGVGGELMIFPHFTVKVEGLWFTFPEKTTSFFSTAGTQVVHFDTQNSFWVGRIGVNYSIC